MEKLIVHDFLILKHIELDLTKINIIIGRQAEGKSILGKLIFFFKDFFIKYRASLLKNQTKVQFNKIILQEFKSIFTDYSWRSENFEITYHLHNYWIKVTTDKLSNGRLKLGLYYSDELAKARRKMTISYQKKKEEDSRKYSVDDEFDTFGYLDELLEKNLFNSNNILGFEQPFFIPAGRSFYANLEENIFAFLSSNISIDYFLKEFGQDYQFTKQIYRQKDNFDKNYLSKINDIVSQIIVGNYVQEDGQDWIYSHKNRKKIKVSNASSGQQEALPMTTLLEILPFITFAGTSNSIFLIEEPEAHLFPQSQKHIIELIALVFNITDKRHRFFITTHSPYILTAFNNLIQAGNTKKKIKERGNKKEELKQLFDIVPENQILDIDDFGVYTLGNGELKSIINQENQLIDTNIIDEVSHEFSDIFEKLVDLELED
ncbi:AAA family ATPase [Aphanothece sacrum]|uniref:AAA domain protein n=1 Tax=Aphanothece sacrum FPU1 TaxID=1920663 RepID=A0A401IJZ7_APHSA|nr:ATP-binding protein [Aphanothece sacrum]GBF81500.1 AAA domain protein [Aphanothece sacrum FPU1]